MLVRILVLLFHCTHLLFLVSTFLNDVRLRCNPYIMCITRSTGCFGIMHTDIWFCPINKQFLFSCCCFLRRFIDINKQYIQHSRKERHKEHSENNNEERKRDKPEAAIVYRYVKLSGMDLIEQFSLYSDQNQIFECKIQIKQGSVDNNGFHVDINYYPII